MAVKKKMKLVAFAEDRWDEPMCNGCYGNIQATPIALLKAGAVKGAELKGANWKICIIRDETTKDAKGETDPMSTEKGFRRKKNIEGT